MEYACRALAQLAKQADADHLTRLEELAQREAVSSNFLVQILNDLRRAGIVASRRGTGGGYVLARAPETVTLRQIVDAVDPALIKTSVTQSGESGAAVARAWERVGAAVVRSLDELTLEHLAATSPEPMFHI